MAKSTMKSKSKSGKSGKAGKSGKSDRLTNSSRAGVIMPVGRLHRLLRKGEYAARTSIRAAVHLAGTLEHIARLIIEKAVKQAGGGRITPQIIRMVIKSDVDLDYVLGHADFASGGVVPFIHPNLDQIRKPKASQFEEAILQPGTKVKHVVIRRLGKPAIVASKKEVEKIVAPPSPIKSSQKESRKTQTD